jgi:hypothetical protein
MLRREMIRRRHTAAMRSIEPGMTEAAFRSGTHGHQIAFPTTAPADIIGFK